jgi:hypothetical protein
MTWAVNDEIVMSGRVIRQAVIGGNCPAVPGAPVVAQSIQFVITSDQI